ncbi:uncharacterized protein LOC129716681 [Wyeomyia smithii]|uniref:uncharacterized protein LOC129716681 n=1 Tax=Wyeomyia smithii TaxID=174621 RepID=UPI002467EB52|nr:uncharacterized protein LOC129716681 [Wyeomyia smithii]
MFSTSCFKVPWLVVLAIVQSSHSASPSWLTNGTIQATISTIFAQTDHIDIVFNEFETDQIEQQINYLVHEGVTLQQKTFRIYGFNASAEDVCVGADTNLPDEPDPGEMIARVFDQEFVFIRWDKTYQTFAKIWVQNHHGGYVLFTDLHSLETLIRCMLDPTGTYLILLDSKGVEFTELERLLKSIWRREGVLRFFVLTAERMLVFNPFLIRNSTYGSVVEVNSASAIPQVPERNFNRYPLRIDIFKSTYSDTIAGKTGAKFDLSGPDVVLSWVFVKKFNFTPIRLPPDKDNFGVRLPNGSYNGAIGRLLRRESDVCFVGFFVKDYFTRDIEFTTGVYADEMCCLVKKASRVPEYLLPITIFPADLWSLLVVAGLVCTVMWIALRAGIQATMKDHSRWSQKYRFAYLFNLSDEIRDAPLYRKLIQICIDSYLLLLSATYLRFTRSGIERLFLFGILMVSLVIVSLFQSGLASVFVNPVYYKDINSLQQLDQAGLRIPVKYKGFMDDVFPANYSVMMESLRNKMELRIMNETLLSYVARVGKVATVTRKTTLSLDNAIFLTTKQLYMIPECPRTYSLAYVVSRHSVLLDRINDFLLRLLDGGLINHWISVMNFNVTLQQREKVRNFEEPGLKVLTVLDLQFPFYMLVIGLGISAVAFVAELMYLRDPAFQDFMNNKVFSGTSGGIQNELIECIESYMLQTIKREVLEFVSIMMDESTDSARLSQLSCTLRYLRPDGTPVERLVRLADVSSDKTAAALAGHVDEIAAYFGLDGDKVVAQNYDGAAVMSGDKSGVQTLVKQRFPKAGYIHCRAHVLSLVLLHSCTNNKKSARFFNTISSLAAFFSQSPKRSETLKQFMETHIPNVCKTKWSYNSRMIKIIDSNYAAINECLDVLYQILQTKELDVVECLRNVKACLASIEELKAEHHFYRTLNDAIDVSGETITDSNGINYRPIYDFIIDKIIDEMSKRFKELDEYKFIILLNHEKFAEFNVTFPTKN